VDVVVTNTSVMNVAVVVSTCPTVKVVHAVHVEGPLVNVPTDVEVTTPVLVLVDKNVDVMVV